MTDLFEGLDFNGEDFAKIIFEALFGNPAGVFEPPIAIFHPGLLLGMMVRSLPDYTSRSIRVPGSTETPFLRIRSGGKEVDFPTLMKTIEVLLDAGVLELSIQTDNRGRKGYLLNAEGYRLYGEWRRSKVSTEAEE